MRKLMTTMLTVLAMAAPATGQDVVYRFEKRVDATGQGAAGQGDFFTLQVPPGGPGGLIGPGVGLLAVEPFDSAEPKPGAPYTADITTEIVQTLADGNRIEHQTTSSVARDGQGRVRREQQLAAIGPILPKVDKRIVTIMNPVDGVHYSLDADRKVALRSPMPEFARAGVAVRARTGSQDQGRPESLGTSAIEGVEAEGTRTIVTIPAGQIGNVAPIEMVSERWFSPELGIVVLSRRSDPRFGETTYRLQNIVRGEPSPELFQVPADYTIEALPAFGAGKMIVKPITP